MNRVNIVYLFAVLCLLVSPSLTAPADNESAKQVDASPEKGSPEIPEPNASNNEVNGDIDGDVENFAPETTAGESTEVASTDKPTYSGVSTGMITRIGVDGPFECRKITCPDGTETCKFASKYSPDGKTAEVQYKCYSRNNTVLLEETKTEDVDHTGFGGMGIDSFFSDFTQRMNQFLDSLLKNFRY